MGQLMERGGYSRAQALGVLAVVCVLCAAVGVLWLAVAHKEKGAVNQPETAAPSVQKKTALAVTKGVRDGRAGQGGALTATSGVKRVAGGVTNAPVVARTPDQRDADSMRELLDGGDEKGALRMARRLTGSPDVDVRAAVVTVLGWVGVRALPELTQMLADEDEGIASDALTQWKMAADEIQDNAEKAELLVAAIGTLREEKDMESLVMTFAQLPDDVTVRSLVQIIQGANPTASEVAREHYTFVTQGDYTTPQAAEQWVLENTEPPAAAPNTKEPNTAAPGGATAR